MKFYNRKNELEIINKLVFSKKSEFVYFMWRRRIWKTSLINYYFTTNNIKYLYFFVWNKQEWNLLKWFEEILEDFLGYKITFDSIRDFLKFLFKYSTENQNLNIVFDEFQNFSFVNNEIFYDFQEFWDQYNKKWKINVFCVGSIYTMMEKIFRDKQAPLFWRSTAKLYINEFWVSTIREILLDYDFYSQENLLDVFSLFGWVPKYLEIFDNLEKNKNISLLENILKNQYITENSLFLREGQDLLLTEFWKTYHIYFSILEAIASGKTKRSEIADYTKINYDSLWLYLEKLEKVYKYIEKNIPIVKHKTKLNRYKITDNFLIFWFRYIYKKTNLIELWKYDELTKFILNDIKNIEWFAFEKMIKQLIIKQNQVWKFIINFDHIWNYWDRGWNEIDLVCFNSTTKEVVFIECKLNHKKITDSIKDNLIKKSETIKEFNGYKKYYLFYSVSDLEKFFNS